MRLEADIEVENDLGEARFFHLVKSFGDGGGRTQKDGIFRQVLGSDVLESINHVDEISIAWRGTSGIGGQGRNSTFPIIAYLAHPLRVLLFLRIGEMREIAAHQPPRRCSVPCTLFMIKVRHLL
jgi:hypothetical protein